MLFTSWPGAGADRAEESDMERSERAGHRWPYYVFAPFASRRTYARLFYTLLAFPLGIAYFVALVTLLSVGASMAITIVGIPLIIITIYAWCWIADADRLLTNVLLDARIPRLDFEREQGMAWGIGRLRARLANPITWRACLYLFLRFPQGVIGFSVLAALLSQAAWGIALPFVFTHIGAANASAQYGSLNYGLFTVDSIGKALIVTAFSPLFLLLAVHFTNLFGWGSARISRALLSTDAEYRPAVMPESLAAVAAWPGVASPRAHAPAQSRSRYLQTRALLWHGAFFGSMTVLFLIITAVATPGEWWAVWPIWAFAIPLAMHVGYYIRGGFGMHAGLFAIVMAGLFAINMRFSPVVWFEWPLLAWLLILALHWWLSKRIQLQQHEEIETHAYQPALAQVVAGGDAPRSETPAYIPASGISVDISMRTVHVDGVPIELTRKEFELLALFVANPGRPFGRDELLDRIWKNEYDVTERTIDTHVQRLRRKLNAHSSAIQTVWGVGYRYQA